MNSLAKIPKNAIGLLRNAVPASIVRNVGHWNKDFYPGPYPLTEAQKAAAAEKYNVHPKEYEAYPDDGYGSGDYPKMPMESGDFRDPFYPWDNPELKRNYGEPLHDDFDLMREDRYDVNKKFHQPMWVLWLQFFGVMGGLYAIVKIMDNAKMFHAVVPPQIPKDGKVHYTFEPSN